MGSTVPKIKQHDVTDCGAACLRSIARHYGIRISTARLRQLASTDRRGTNVLGLVAAAETLGFQSKGVRATPELLERIPLPAIAHVVRGALAHFVVVAAVAGHRVQVMDPADGTLSYQKRESFLSEWTQVLVVLVPGVTFQASKLEVSPLSRFWELASPHTGILLEALVGSIVLTVLGLSSAIYVQKIVDNVLADGNRNLLNLTSMIVLVILAIQLVIGALKSILALQLGQRIDAQLLLGYYRQLLRLPQQFFDTMRVGEIVSRFNDAAKIRAFINEAAVEMIVNATILVAAFSVLFLYSYRIAFMAAGMLPLFAVLAYVANRVNRSRLKELMVRSAALEAQLIETLNNVATVKRLGVEWSASVRMEEHFVRLLERVYSTGVNAIVLGSTGQLIIRSFTIIVLWTGATLVLSHDLSPGQLMSCYTLLGYLTGPMIALIGANRSIQDAMIAAGRLFEIFDLEPEEPVRGLALAQGSAGDVTVENVTLRYGSGAQILNGLSLRARRGELTAVVGESGCGKSTFASLLQRIYPYESGVVRIGDIDIGDVRLSSLRRIVGVVPQKVDLFADSLLANIAVGIDEPDLLRVSSLCRSLGIDHLASRMPGGLNGLISEMGSNLSGGERQRIAIARALYHRPDILILDEATSALDATSEHCIRAAIDQFRLEGHTVISIAHRLGNVVNADRIYVMLEGRVVEDGTHDQLLTRRGHYFDLWSHQHSLCHDRCRMSNANA